MAALRDQLSGAELLVEWNRGFGDHPDGHPRYAIDGGMNRFAKDAGIHNGHPPITTSHRGIACRHVRLASFSKVPPADRLWDEQKVS